MTSLGKEIRKARIDSGMNQKELAQRSALSQKYMSQIERDDADPRISVVKRIATALGVSLDLLTREEG